MSNRVLYVASAVQVALLKEVILQQLKTGFWKDHRPAQHGYQWDGVDILCDNTTTKLGAEGWKIPRTYNFVNPEFLKENEHGLVAAAQSVKPSSNFKSVKKELIELSRIVGGRLADRNGEITKANRGNNKTLDEKIAFAKKTVTKASEETKRTAVKRPGGSVVTRVPVVRAVEVVATTENAAQE